MTTVKKLIVYSLFVFLSAVLAGAQCIGSCTSVTATLTDGAGQVWTLATVTINIVKPFGNPGQILNNGVPINSSSYTVTTNLTGVFTISLDDNNVLTPAGTTWSFTLCPNATVQNCTQVTQFITGSSLDLSTILSAALITPVVNTAPTIFRAYNDLEALGGQGSVYWRTTDNTLRGCFGAPCPSSWIPIGSGGGGGSGTINNGNLNFLSKYVTNPNGIVLGPDTNLDDGATIVGALSYKGAVGLNLPSDSIHAGSVQIGGNTTLPTILSNNAFGFIGPNSASFTSWFLQPASGGPSNATPIMSCGTPVGNISPCTFIATPVSGITCGTTCTTNTLSLFTSPTAVGNSPFSYDGVNTISSTAALNISPGPNNTQAANFSTTYTGSNCTGSGSIFTSNVPFCNTQTITSIWPSAASGPIAGLSVAMNENNGTLAGSPAVTAIAGVNFLTITTNPGGVATWVTGLMGLSTLSGSHGTATNFGGVFGKADLGTSTIQIATEAFGVAGQISSANSGATEPSGAALIAESPILTGIVSNIYGLHIKDQTVGGGTNNPNPHAIVTDGTAVSSFGGGIQQNGTPIALQCGTTTSCANTATPLAHIVFGNAPLVSGTPSTAAVTGISPAFTSTSTYDCTVSNNTTQANPVKVTKVSGSAVTFTGPTTVTDVVSYICVGT